MDRKTAVFLIVVLLLALVRAMACGVASYLSISSREHLDHDAAAKADALSARFIESDSRRIRLSHELDPCNPEYIENMARLGFIQAEFSGSADRPDLENSLNLIRTSLVIRPVSAYAWSMLLYAKGKLGQIDQEYSEAMDNSLVLGPNEPDVLRTVIDTGFEHWQELGEKQRIEIKDVLLMKIKADHEPIGRVLQEGNG